MAESQSPLLYNRPIQLLDFHENYLFLLLGFTNEEKYGIMLADILSCEFF